MSLAPLDYLVVGVFVAAILALGFSARLRDNSVLQFLAAGRGLTLPAFVATLVSTWYGGILGIGESVSYFGVGTWLLLGAPYYVFAVIYAGWLAPRVRGADQISIPERLDSRYDRRVGILGGVLLFLLAVPAAHVLMLGVLLTEVSGIPLPVAEGIVALVGTALLYRGGLLADVRVALLAFVMMYVGFGTMVAVCLTKMPLTSAVAAIPTPELRSFSGGVGPTAIVSFFILGAWTLVDPGFHQRVASCRDPQTGRKGVLVSTLFWILFDLLSITTGIYSLVMLKPFPSAEPLTVFPRLGELVLPAGLKAVFLCGMIGTIMSALVGYTLVAGASLGREIVGRIRPLSEAQTTGWIRVGFGVAALLAVGLALLVDSVVALWYAWAGAVVGALLLPTAFAYGRRVPRAGVTLWSTIVAFGVSLAWMVFCIRTNNPLQEVAWIQTDQGGSLTLLPNQPIGGRDATVFRFSLGTLLPGLVISALGISLGQALGRRKREA